MMAAKADRNPRRIFWLKFSIASGLAVGFLLSRHLWISSRFYPLSPVWSGLPSPPHPVDYWLFTACLVLLVLIACIPKPPKWIAAFTLLAASLALLDQSRWQPWFYQYMLMLITVGFACRPGATPQQETTCLNSCRLVVVSVYLWSGIQKMNSGFVHDIFPWLIEPLTRLLPAFVATRIAGAGPVVPITECGIALLLLTTKYRDAAVIAAVAMHAFILAALGPTGHDGNSVIWSWNVIMASFVVLLFGHSPDFRAGDLILPRGALFPKVVLALCMGAPLLSIFHLWDNYLSWALYAGNKDTAELHITDALERRLPEQIREYVTEEHEHTKTINIADWSGDELNVPPYPETRIYKSIARYVCGYASQPHDVTLIVQNKRALFNGGRRSFYDCSNLWD